MLVDTHCHLDFPELATELPTLLANMTEHGVSHAVCIGVDLPHFPNVLALAEQHPQLFATVGVHPDYQNTPEPTVATLTALAAHAKVIGIGETGLDYYRHTDSVSKTRQQERFRIHIQAAKACNKPLIVHTRLAGQDTLAILREEKADTVGGVIHCFTENAEFATAALELGFYLSFSGIVTFKNARDLQAIAANIPLSRLLVETDAPYLAPVPHRGKMNQPAWVHFVADFIAQQRHISLAELTQATTANFTRLFRQTLTPI